MPLTDAQLCRAHDQQQGEVEQEEQGRRCLHGRRLRHGYDPH